jgi:putative SOS response-associated peptidase YedK
MDAAMTSRYALTSPPETVRTAFGLAAIDDFPPREAIAPTEPVGIVRLSPRGMREFRLVRWGLIPGWMRDPSQISTLFSARAETAAEKPAFRGGLRHRRCLVPADAFYVWSGAKGRRKSHLVRPRAGGPIAFAGIADHWIGADGSELETMAILTVEANSTLTGLAERMPAIVHPDAFAAWIDCRAGADGSVPRLLAPPPEDFLEVVDAGPPVRARRKGTEGA